MIDANMAPVKVNTTGKCKKSLKNLPITLRGENIISKIKPITVGGNTIGNTMKLSKSLVIKPRRLYNHLDIKTPNIVTIIVLITATLNDIQNGVTSGIFATSYTLNLYFFKISCASSVFKNSTHAIANFLSEIAADLYVIGCFNSAV